MTRRRALSVLALVVLCLCATLLTVLHISSGAIRDARIQGVAHQAELATVSVDWTDARPFDASGVSAPFVSGLAGSDPRLLGAFGRTTLELGTRVGEVESKSRIALVQGDMFSTLGLSFVRGAAELGPRQAVISHRFWQRAYHGRDDVVGQQLQVHGRSMEENPWTALTIVGVTGEDFVGIRPDLPEDIWIAWNGWPNILLPSVETDAFVSQAMPLDLTVRVAGGTDLGALAADLSGRALQSELFKRGEARIAVTPGAASSFAAWAAFEKRSRLFSLLSAMLVLVAVSSIAATQALASSRSHREDLLRSALGEGSGRRYRRWLVDASRTGIPPAIVGVVIAALIFYLLRTINDDRVTWLIERFDWRRAAPSFAQCLSVLALSATTLSLLTRYGVHRMVANGRSSLGSRGSTSPLLLTPVAGAVIGVIAVAVVAAGVLSELRQLQTRSFGFEPEQLYAANVIPRSGDNKQAFARLLNASSIRPLLSELRDLPQGRFALASSAPFGIPLVRDLPQGAKTAQIFVNEVSPGYFDLLKLPLTAGRYFDTVATNEIVVTPKFAQRFLSPGSPIGQRLQLSSPRGGQEELTIVGVVPDIQRVTAREESTGVVYRSLTSEAGFWSVIADSETAQRVGVMLERYFAGGAQGSDWALSPMEPLSERVDWAYRAEWLEVQMLIAVAIGLILIGLYAVVAMIQSLILERAQEMAVRRCLGAPRARLILSAVGVSPAVIVGFVLVAALATYGFARIVLPELSESSLAFATLLSLLVLGVGWGCVLAVTVNSRLERALLQSLKEAGF